MSVGVVAVGDTVIGERYNKTHNKFHISLDRSVELDLTIKSSEMLDSDYDDMDDLTPQPVLPPESEDDDEAKVVVGAGARTTKTSRGISDGGASMFKNSRIIDDDNNSIGSVSPVHQSGSYPRSLQECGGQGIETGKPISRSKSTPIIASKKVGPRRVIFPSIHHHDKPQDIQIDKTAHTNMTDVRTSSSFRPPPQRKSFDTDIPDINFNDSLKLNYVHKQRQLATTVSKEKKSQDYCYHKNVKPNNKNEKEIRLTSDYYSSSVEISTSPPSISSTSSSISKHATNKLSHHTKRPPKPGPSILRRSRSLPIRKNTINTLKKTTQLIDSSSPMNASLPSDDALSYESTLDTFRTNSPLLPPAFPPIPKSPSEDSTFRRRNSENCVNTGKHISENEEASNSGTSLVINYKKIKFDPRVWVVEFKRSKDEDIWFTPTELDQFRLQAIKRIQQREMRMISSGTGRVINVRPSGNAVRAIYTNPALSIDDDECDDETSKVKLSGSTTPSPSVSFISPNTESFQKILTSEIKSVLVVDPHDLFLKLITKGIVSMLPHVSVTTAHNAGGALERIFDAREKSPLSEGGCTHGFDLIIVEERLTLLRSMYSRQNGEKNSKPQSQRHQFPESGSGLIHNIVREEINMLTTWKLSNWWRSSHPRFALLIGMSAHLDQDREKMKQVGADMMWGKPPPSLNKMLRREILKILLKKRDRRDVHLSKSL